MFFFDCEAGYQPDDGQNDVTDGSVENYPLDWETGEAQPDEETDEKTDEKKEG